MACSLLGHWTWAVERAEIDAPIVPHVLVVNLLISAVLVVFALLFPPYGYDAYTYHLPMVAVWMQTGNLSTKIPYNGYSNVYPADTELIYTWLALFVHNYSLQSLCQVFYSLAGWLAVAGIGRVVGLRRSWLPLSRLVDATPPAIPGDCDLS